MKARIIIGANYGDEGKGTVVAKYAKQSNSCLNILTNGGPQRGHSIVTEQGITTFKHFGSGTYHGADNYYSRFFILSPIQFVTEYRNLIVKPHNIYRDIKCMWSTPYDIMFNLITHHLDNKHNTCGMGIWNTIKRYKTTRTIDFDAFVSDAEQALKYLGFVKSYYETQLEIPDVWKSIWNSEYLQLHFIEDCNFFKAHTIPVDGIKTLTYTDLIFENGQGLLLSDRGKDEEDRTPSNTGIHDALEIIKDITEDINITAHYVTRPYLTRHGIGSITDESPKSNISVAIGDDINVYNDYQGSFRYGKLDVDDLRSRIFKDAGNIKYEIELTHCDEMDRVAEFEERFAVINTIDSPLI